MNHDILLVEDEPGIAESLVFILTRARWTVQAITDGDAAIAAVHRLRPRMVLLDVMLPNRSGFEVLKQIRDDKLVADLPVMLLTARGQPHDRRIASDLGADAFVTKPYSNTEVVETVRRVLEKGARP